VLDRSESMTPKPRRAVHESRNGTFELKPTTFSVWTVPAFVVKWPTSTTTACLICSSPPTRQFRPALSMARYESKVYWNTGLHGAKENHWLRLRFSGVKDAELIGARVEVSARGMRQYRWIHANHSYKSGGALEAHFGLASATAQTSPSRSSAARSSLCRRPGQPAP